MFSFNEFCTCPKSLLRRKTLASLNLYSSNKGSYGGGGRVKNFVVAFLPLTEIKCIETVGRAVVFWEL